MLIINGEIQIQESSNIFERTYNMRGANRRCIEIHFDPQEGLTHDYLTKVFADGAHIVRQENRTVIEQVCVQEATETEEAIYKEVERIETTEYDLSAFVVGGDIIDKRNGSFVVYMGVKTEAEKLNEEMAELLLMVGGIE